MAIFGGCQGTVMNNPRSPTSRTPVCYTMKTSARSPAGGPSHKTLRPGGKSSSRSTTPLTSPTKMPYSVGQPYPPKPSPGMMPDRAPSPNYFGLVVEGTADQRDSSAMPREQWSPPSSSVKPFAAAIPKQVPLDANPEFAAFKRQADLNRGKSGFNLPTSHGAPTPSLAPSTSDPTQLLRPKPPRWNTHSSAMSDVSMQMTRPGQFTREPSMMRMDVDQEGLRDSAYGSLDSKRTSESSTYPPTLDTSRRDAGAMIPPPISISESRSTVSKAEDRDPRLSIMGNRPDPPSPKPHRAVRSETLPPKMGETGPSMILPNQLDEMLATDSVGVLLLDVRSAQNFAQAHIEGALNLCIPTTLLKRATFNLQKLQQTFQRSGDQAVFSRWRDAEHLVVYDAFSSEQTEATTATNMIKKFTNEGYKGSTSILRGGFQYFAEEYPELIHYQARESPVASPVGAGNGLRTGLAPVIGGVMLPTSGNTPNPFFSNIRQNMDLADGVGQMDIMRPSGLESPTLPSWLRNAAAEDDHGKRVSDKFLNIEKDEQSRMKQAYSLFGGRQPSQLSNQVDCPQLCGIEQGGKNRYKDILPFEHARVRLAGTCDGASDYVNASHIKASGSNKRYIATQGPLPTTFEDFWSVIWDQDVRVIVMLTAESEGGQLKCHQYWQGRDYGSIRLKSLSEKKVSLEIDKHRSDSTVAMSSSTGETGRRRANTVSSTESSSSTTPQPTPGPGDTPHVIIRKFALSHASQPFAPIREITHLHYPSWPDFGVPARPAHLLALVELANVMQRAALPIETSSMSRRAPETQPITWYDEPEAETRARPMLVHCSAGCGRTGAFCTVDTVIDMLKRQRTVRLARTMRARREREQEDRRRDGDGADADADAMDVDEGISPLSTRQMSFSGMPPPTRRTSAGSGSTATTTGTGTGSGVSAPLGPPLDVSWVEDETTDLIQKTVEDFRRQRLSMVQSLRQFVLCYEAMVEWTWRMNEKTVQSAVGGAGAGGAGGRRGPGGRARSGSLYTRREG